MCAHSKGKSLTIARLMVVVIHAPIIACALNGYSVLSLFLIANMVCVCCFMPVMLGLWNSPLGRKLITESGLIFSCTIAILTVCAYGVGNVWDANDWRGSIYKGCVYAWLNNGYAWDYFLVAFGSSCVGLALWIILAQTLALCGIQGCGISTVLMCVPGFKYLAGIGAADAAVGKADNDGNMILGELPIPYATDLAFQNNTALPYNPYVTQISFEPMVAYGLPSPTPFQSPDPLVVYGNQPFSDPPALYYGAVEGGADKMQQMAPVMIMDGISHQDPFGPMAPLMPMNSFQPHSGSC